MVALTQYLQIRHHEMVSLFETPVKDWKRKDYHNLRLTLKKINSLISLVLFSSSEFNAEKHFKPFRELFHRAGKIRNLQLEEAWMAKHANPAEMHQYSTYHTKKLAAQRKKLKSLVGAKVPAELRHSFKDLQDALKVITSIQVDHYISSRRDAITEFTRQQEFTVEELHQCRKLLKDYRYITDALARAAGQQEEKKDDFVDLLGRWHDSEVLVGRLEKLKKRQAANHDSMPSFNKKSEVAKQDALELFGEIVDVLHSSSGGADDLLELHPDEAGVSKNGRMPGEIDGEKI